MKIEVHHYLHGDTEAERLIFEALHKILTELSQMKKQETKEMANIDEILAEVSAQTTKIDGIDTLMDGMRQQIADLIAQQGNIPPELQEKIDAVFSTAQANSAKIDAAIAENVPA